MRIYIFKSETRKELRAFAGDPIGSKLPQNHGPWTVTGVVGPHKAPPHNFSRNVIEEAIDGEGFQLWRLGKRWKPKPDPLNDREPAACPARPVLAEFPSQVVG
jgi:hypothetical protein